MDIMFKSTRGDKNYVTASQAIVQGIANDGGLFVPETIPTIDFPLEKITEMSYQELAYEVLKLILTDYTEEELKQVPGEFTPSPFVKKITGVDNVCERSAVLASGNGRLLQRKTGENGVTTAVAAREWRIHFE